jgi:hypothetical protein
MTGCKKMYRWRISRIRGTPAQFIGFVEPPNEASAITKAVEEFGITVPEKKRRLVAQRVT